MCVRACVRAHGLEFNSIKSTSFMVDISKIEQESKTLKLLEMFHRLFSEGKINSNKNMKLE